MTGGHQLPRRKAFAVGDQVVVHRVVGWGSRPEDRRQVAGVVIMPTPQFGDTYLVEYVDGRRDVVAVNRIDFA